MTDPKLKFPHLLLEGVSFAWPEGVALRNVHAVIERGGFYLLSGPSGSGKSTLLRLIVRLETPHQGRIVLNGTDIQQITPTLLRRQVALVSQEPRMGAVTVQDALLLPFTFAINADLVQPDEAAMREVLDLVHLEHVGLKMTADTLSLGVRQRVALARTLLLKPSVWLLDEPTSALDQENKQLVEQVIENANSHGITIVMITHTGYTPARPHTVWKLSDGCIEELVS